LRGEWKPWEDWTYGLYWNTEPPSIKDKLSDPARLAQTSWDYLGLYMRYLFMDTPHNQLLSRGFEVRPFSFSKISTYWTGFPAVLGILLYISAGMRKRCSRTKKEGISEDSYTPFYSTFFKPGYGLFMVVGVAVILPLSILWFPLARLATPIIPLAVIIGWTTVHSLISLIVRKPFSSLAAGTGVVILVSVWAIQAGREIHLCQAKERFPWHEEGQSLMTVGDWLHENAPGSITMTEHPWELCFYSKGKTVRLPEAPLGEVIKVARYYGVTHIVPDGFDRTLFPWVQGRIPGLTKVCSTPGLELFAIDYSGIDREFHEPEKR